MFSDAYRDYVASSQDTLAATDVSALDLVSTQVANVGRTALFTLGGSAQPQVALFTFGGDAQTHAALFTLGEAKG